MTDQTVEKTTALRVDLPTWGMEAGTPEADTFTKDLAIFIESMANTEVLPTDDNYLAAFVQHRVKRWIGTYYPEALAFSAAFNPDSPSGLEVGIGYSKIGDVQCLDTVLIGKDAMPTIIAIDNNLDTHQLPEITDTLSPTGVKKMQEYYRQLSLGEATSIPISQQLVDAMAYTTLGDKLIEEQHESLIPCGLIRDNIFYFWALTFNGVCLCGTAVPLETNTITH